MRDALKTPRLTLRAVSAADQQAVVTALNDLEVSGWLAVVPHPYAPADFQYFLTEIAKPGVAFAVDDEAGFCGILSIEDGVLGYWLALRCHGKGYATEAARAALAEHLSHDTNDIESGYFEGNARSANVLRKLGFVEVGRGMKHCRALGVDRAHVDMTLTLDSFVAARPIKARSARLTYRSWQAVDIEAMHALNSDWRVVRQLGSWPWPPEPGFTATRAQPFAGDGFAWAVLQDGAVIGGISVTNGEIGYSLAPSHWGQGFAHEAAVTALDRAFADPALTQVHAGAWDDNEASFGLLIKLGFVETARSVEPSKARKADTGLVKFGLSRAAWLANPR